MFKSKTTSIVGLTAALSMYIGACGFFLKQVPSPKLPAYKSCEESCTTNIQFYAPHESQRMSVGQALSDVFENYDSKEVGYYVAWNGDVCELRVYANSPNTLAPLLSKLEAHIGPFIEGKTHNLLNTLDGLTYSLFSRI